MVIKKLAPACILKSEGGLGKSYLVRKKLKEHCKPDEYEIRNGHITPLSLYKLMYGHKDGIIMLDDVEDVLKNDIAVGILKAGLWDVEGNGKREITWTSTSAKLGDVPQKFTFNGGIILLCNKIPKRNDSVVKAFRTRGLEYEIQLTYKQKLKIFQQLIDSADFFKIAGVNLEKDDREQLKKDLEEHTSVVMENFNFRTVVKLIKFYVYGKQHHPDKPDLYIILHKKTNHVDEEKEIVLNLMKKKLPVSQEVQQFRELTGKSRATYYRIKKILKGEII